MTDDDRWELSFIWAAVLTGAILFYVVLAEFDLGVGVLFGTTCDEAHRVRMLAPSRS